MTLRTLGALLAIQISALGVSSAGQYFGYLAGADNPTDLSATAPYTNIAKTDANCASCTENLVTRVTAMNQQGVKAMVDLGTTLFYATCPAPTLPGDCYSWALQPAYQASWNTFTQLNSAILTPASIASFYLMDEPTWRGVSAADLQKANDLVKGAFPTIPTSIVEAYLCLDPANPCRNGNALVIPTSSLFVPTHGQSNLDWVGFDVYDVFNPATDATYQKYVSQLKSLPSYYNQSTIYVEDGFWGWYYDSQNIKHFDHVTVAECEMPLVQLNYYNAFVKDPKSIALVVFLWPNLSSTEPGSQNLDQNVRDAQEQNGSHITGKNSGYINPSPPPFLSSLAFSPGTVSAGVSTTGTVAVSNAACSAGTTVSLSSNSPAVLFANNLQTSSVIIPGGQTSASFGLATNTTACAPLTATITATYSGYTKTATVTVNPATPSYAGSFDSIGFAPNTYTPALSGWAWDADNPNCSTQVDLDLDGSTLLTTVTANAYSATLKNEGIGNGYHAWTFTTTGLPQDGVAHNVAAKHHVTQASEVTSPRGFAYNVPMFPTLTPPTTDYVAGATGGEIGSQFHATYSGYVKALRFYESPYETGNHKLNLWNDTGTLLGSATTSATGAGWHEATLGTPVLINAGTNYRVSYNVNANGHYYKDPCSPAYPFTNSVSKGNYGFSIVATEGVYATNATQGSFPNGTACSNVFADVKFYAGTQTGSNW